jgi:hypothetical protein
LKKYRLIEEVSLTENYAQKQENCTIAATFLGAVFMQAKFRTPPQQVFLIAPRKTPFEGKSKNLYSKNSRPTNAENYACLVTFTSKMISDASRYIKLIPDVVDIEKDEKGHIGISIGGGAPFCPCL